MTKNSLPKKKIHNYKQNYRIMTHASIYKLLMYCYIVSHAY